VEVGGEGPDKVVEVRKERNMSEYIACTLSTAAHSGYSTHRANKTGPADSSVNLFSPVPLKLEDDDGEIDEEALSDLEMKLVVEYEIGEALKMKVCPAGRLYPPRF
jgi:hypothetical protein